MKNFVVILKCVKWLALGLVGVLLLGLSACKTVVSQTGVHHTTIYYNAAGEVLSYRDSVIWAEDCAHNEFVPFVLTKKPLVREWGKK